ncbi:FHA domain-containing protein FhaA [Roseimaritima multifibrata]|uniref:FHA domain-containing protein FhaA n=1 Tax=Roseimaritima multifibrata TaxID=1930274 RepID=A0A517MN32_9BACT|nr:FHA domain-containing protein [Roseimaritima multifibrata]QDS96298.1 FHA domain-containing protein FhaA [Roseimaritima multifibrata]
MSEITITILHGADRGKVYRELTVPMTIGREEGNSIQLNDERVSRCHLKVQRDNDRLVLTDLDSTNGTKVNGQETHLRILRYGDLIAVGRSLMLIGSDEQIAQRMARLNAKSGDGDSSVSRESASYDGSMGFDVGDGTPPQLAGLLGLIEPPEIPDRMSAGQAAQFCEILEYLQARLQKLIESAEIDDATQQVQVNYSTWQRLLDLQARLATLVRSVANP